MAGLYVHTPFCHSKCAYCDFYSMPRDAGHQQWAQAIGQEFDLRMHELSEPIHTIYFGGGTPSILSADIIKRLADKFLSSTLCQSGIEEFTIEANPEDITPEKLQTWRNSGINRISMGVQSFDDEQLQIIGRRHSAQQAWTAAKAIGDFGFDNFSLDLIYGLPGQTLQSWSDSLNKLLELRPKHFSAYLLTYEPRTRLAAMLKTGKIRQASEDLIIQMYELLCKTAKAHGYNHYEISNFALEKFEAKHNSHYWDYTPYLGLGPAAHSFDGMVRRFNPANLSLYLEIIQSGKTAYEIDSENDDNRFNDLLLTSLRTNRGLKLQMVPAKRLSTLLRDAKPYLDQGKLLITKSHPNDLGTLYIPELHWLVSDDIISSLIQI